MPIRRNRDHERQAVSLLATAFVIVAGAAATAFMVLAVAERASWTDWAVWGSMFGGVVFIILSMLQPREKQMGWQRLAFWTKARDDTDPLETYRFRKRRTSTTGGVGTNQPPTLESVRESAAQGSVRWVPHGSVPERDRRPMDKKRQK